MKFYTTSFLCILMVAFTACNDGNKKDNPATVEVASGDDVTQNDSKKPTIGEVTFNDPNMAIVFREYLGLKDAMVGTNPAKTAAQASRLMTAFTDMKADEAAVTAAENVMNAGHMDRQREAFVELTAIVEQMLEGEVASGTIYKQYCPMAFNNTGASWLSNSSDIMNPYFGSKMLRCGRIDGKIE